MESHKAGFPPFSHSLEITWGETFFVSCCELVASAPRYASESICACHGRALSHLQQLGKQAPGKVAYQNGANVRAFFYVAHRALYCFEILGESEAVVVLSCSIT